MGDAEDERGVDERMLAFTEGLVALQAAVTHRFGPTWKRCTTVSSLAEFARTNTYRV